MASVIFFQQVGVLPRDHVFEPGHVVLLERLAQPDAGIHADVAEVVGGERDIHADLLAHRGHIVGHHLDALVRDLDAGEHVLHVAALRDGHRPPGA